MTPKEALTQAIVRCEGTIARASIDISDETQTLAVAASANEAIGAADAIVAARQRIRHHEAIMVELRHALNTIDPTVEIR